MGNAATTQKYTVTNASKSQGADPKHSGGKGKKGEKSNANTPKKHGGTTAGSNASPKLHQKVKTENQNSIAEEVEDVEPDQIPITETTRKDDMQTPSESSLIEDVKEREPQTMPLNNQVTIAPVLIKAQSATVMPNTNVEEYYSLEDDSTPSDSNLSSETPSHHATGENIEAQASTHPTPLGTTPHVSETKVDADVKSEISSPNISNLILPVEDTRSRIDVSSEENEGDKIEAKLGEERLENTEESKGNESIGENNPNENEIEEARVENEIEEARVENKAEEARLENEAEEARVENEAEEARAENETEKVPTENETEKIPVENESKHLETEEPTSENNTEGTTIEDTVEGTTIEATTEAVIIKSKTEVTGAKTEEENKEPAAINTSEPMEQETVQAETFDVAVTSEEDENAEKSNLLLNNRNISRSEQSNTAEGDKKIESSSDIDVQLSAEELHVKDCLTEIAVVKNEAEGLKIEVETYNGTKEDRDYLHLSEMLMRKLYKLDSIESKKNEEIRKWKKDAVLFVKDVTQILEDKVVANSNK